MMLLTPVTNVDRQYCVLCVIGSLAMDKFLETILRGVTPPYGGVICI